MKYSLSPQHGDTADEYTTEKDEDCTSKSTGTQSMAHSTTKGPAAQHGKQSTRGNEVQSYSARLGNAIDHSHSHSTETQTMKRQKVMTLEQISRYNRIKKQKRIEAQLREQTQRIENTYDPGHIFHGVTFNDPEETQAYTGPSYVGLAFSDLIKSKDWKHARKTFAGLLLNGHTVESARIATVTAHGV